MERIASIQTMLYLGMVGMLIIPFFCGGFFCFRELNQIGRLNNEIPAACPDFYFSVDIEWI